MVGMCLSSSSSSSSSRSVSMGSSLFPQPLHPWASCLSDTYLSHFCSACFSYLSSSSSSSSSSSTMAFPCHGPCNGRILYCSSICRDLDLPLHLHSAECFLLSLISSSPSLPYSDPFDCCDLRLALRLLAFYEKLNASDHFLLLEKRRERSPEIYPYDSRLGGLMSNRRNLLRMVSDDTEIIKNEQEQANLKGEQEERDEEVSGFSSELKSNVLLMYKARQSLLSSPVSKQNHQMKSSRRSYAEEILLLEEVICQVVTNGVHIPMDPLTMSFGSCQNSTSTDCSDVGGHSSHHFDGHLGSAIYGPLFSWINHSCRPNAYYTFLLGNSIVCCDDTGHDIGLFPDVDISDELKEAWGLQFFSQSVSNQYGPRLHLRSICDILELDPVCISYIDLLQPMNTRMVELWTKYRFDCKCERCNMTPMGYADNSLGKIGLPGSESECLEHELQDEFEHGLNELMTNDNPHICCEVLERALFKIIQETREGSFCENLPLLMHRSCLDIYMVLSSSYKILAAGYDHQEDEQNISNDNSQGDVKNESRIARFALFSAAYALILAGCVQNLYNSGEVGLIDSASRFWLECGESLINAWTELDRCFDIDTISEHKKFHVYLHSNDNSFLEKLLRCDLKEFLGADARLNNDMDEQLESFIVEILQKLVDLIWPVVQGSSLFLSSIITPFNINEISSVVTTFDSKDNSFTRESWIRHRVPMLLCALCALQHSFTLAAICHGRNEQCVKVFRNVLCTHFITRNDACT